MSDTRKETEKSWWRTPLLQQIPSLRQREDQVFLVLMLVIGVLTGLAVVAFILLTERLGMRLYPVGGAAWRRVLTPVAGSLGVGYLLFRCSATFRTLEAAAYRRPKLRCSPAKV